MSLRFRGLNSYRESQHIDFDDLGRAGLFGIFGPTGSGKSSILDAITLALFGTVDRSPRGTGGIINQQEQYCEVSFTFGLGGVRYKVERRYDRAPGDLGGVRARYARLVSGEGTVLADTPRATSEKVEALLGLTQKEFSRAVVLPQGKFDAFLRLTGSERAEMLERIFDLERFGEDLRQRAVGRRDNLKARLGELDAVKRELGDCSDDSIRAAEHAALQKDLLLRAAEKLSRETEEAFRQQSELRGLYGELESAKANKVRLDTESEAMEGLKTSLDLARKAAPLRNLIEQVRGTEKMESGLTHDLGQCRSLLSSAVTVHGTAQARLRASEKRREDDESSLLERKMRLAEAVTVKAGIAGLSQRLHRWEGEMAETVRESEKASCEEAACREKIATIDTGLDALSARRLSLSVDPGERGLLDLAVAAAVVLESARDARGEAEGLLQARTRETEKQRAGVHSVFMEIAGLAATRCRFDESGGLHVCPDVPVAAPDSMAARELRETADRELALAEGLVHEARDWQRKAVVRDRAALLAKELVDGGPCPVCGSVHHPAPASGEASLVDAADRAEEIADECLRRVRQWRDLLLTAILKWENASRNETESWETLHGPGGKEEAFAGALAAFRTAAEALLGSDGRRDDAPDLVKARRAELLAKDQQLRSVAGEIEASQKSRLKYATALDALTKRVGGLAAKKASLDASVRSVGEQIDRDSDRLRALAGEDDPEILLPRVESELKDIQDELTEAKRLEESAGKARESLDLKVAGLASQLAQVTSDLRSLRESLAQELASAGFRDAGEAERAMLLPADELSMGKRLEEYKAECIKADGELWRLSERIAGRPFSEEEFNGLGKALEDAREEQGLLQKEAALAQKHLSDLRDRRYRWNDLEKDRIATQKAWDVADRLVRLVQGRRLVQFLAEEHLRGMTLEASARLGSLTGQRYALEIANGGEFVIRDDFHGGERRAVSTLSGGETFLTSLSLALALSSNLQLRGQFPLGFFFLDEGFGTLDDDRLDLVMSALEKVRDGERVVGIISHRQELKDRLPRYLEVVPARDDGTGSMVVARR